LQRLADCASTRSFSVSRPFSSTQALKADSVGPAVRRYLKTSSVSFFGPQTAPPSTRPWPSMYLVAEWMTRSAPSSSGRCRMGVQKQLSTATRMPWAWAMAVRARISAISVSGLDGVSRKNSFVSGWIAASHAAGSVCGTKVVVMPVRVQDVREQLHGGAEQAVGSDDVVALLEVRQHSRHDRRHAAGRGDAILGAFERGEALLEHGDGRIGEAGVNVALLFAGKAPGGLRRTLEDKAGGQVQRLGVLAELAALLAGTNGQRFRGDSSDAQPSFLPAIGQTEHHLLRGRPSPSSSSLFLAGLPPRLPSTASR
jgi:hypothetical protein